MTNPVQRVTSVLADQMPKLEKMCDEVSAIGNSVVLRAVNAVHSIGQQFKTLDDTVTELEKLAGLSNSAAMGVKPVPGPESIPMPQEVNPNGPLAE